MYKSILSLGLFLISGSVIAQSTLPQEPGTLMPGFPSPSSIGFGGSTPSETTTASAVTIPSSGTLPQEQQSSDNFNNFPSQRGRFNSTPQGPMTNPRPPRSPITSPQGLSLPSSGIGTGTL